MKGDVKYEMGNKRAAIRDIENRTMIDYDLIRARKHIEKRI